MAAAQSVLGRDFGKKAVRLGVTVAGLLILRGILGALPMLKNASAIGSSLMTPLVIADAVVDTVLFVVLLRFGMQVGRSIADNYTRLPDLGRIISLATVTLVLILAYELYQTPVACLLVMPSDLSSLSGGTVPANVQDLARVWSQVLQQAGMQNSVGDALAAYQREAVTMLRKPPDIYGWTFLILVAIPVVGIVVLVSRNLDTFTELISRAAAGPARSAQTSGAAARSTPATRVERTVGPAGQGISPVHVVERLSKLKELLDSGVISRDDFENQKRRILRPTIPDSKPAPQPDGIRRLKALLDSGALTEEEYETQKKRLLEEL